MAWKGAANVDGKGNAGVTIDLSALNQVQILNSWFPYGAVRTDKVVKISSGAHWRDVYAEECKNRTITIIWPITMSQRYLGSDVRMSSVFQGYQKIFTGRF